MKKKNISAYKKFKVSRELFQYLGKMYLDKFYPGITLEKILENTELKILRKEYDPQRLILD